VKTRVSPAWLDGVREDIRRFDRNDVSTHFERVLSYNLAAQAMVVLLTSANIPFKVFNLGAGVKRITTDTQICPCCKRRIE